MGWLADGWVGDEQLDIATQLKGVTMGSKEMQSAAVMVEEAQGENERLIMCGYVVKIMKNMIIIIHNFLFLNYMFVVDVLMWGDGMEVLSK